MLNGELAVIAGGGGFVFFDHLLALGFAGSPTNGARRFSLAQAGGHLAWIFSTRVSLGLGDRKLLSDRGDDLDAGALSGPSLDVGFRMGY